MCSYIFIKEYRKSENPYCGILLPFLDVVRSETTCQIKPIQPASCSDARRLFFSKSIARCDGGDTVEYCKIELRVMII